MGNANLQNSGPCFRSLQSPARQESPRQTSRSKARIVAVATVLTMFTSSAVLGKGVNYCGNNGLQRTNQIDVFWMTPKLKRFPIRKIEILPASALQRADSSSSRGVSDCARGDGCVVAFDVTRKRQDYSFDAVEFDGRFLKLAADMNDIRRLKLRRFE
jgi:hypothetical protein